jgi:hypothetical protein
MLVPIDEIVTIGDGASVRDGTLLVRRAVLAEPVAEELPVVESEAVAWQDMSDEQRVEVIVDDKVEVEQIASVEQVAEAPEPEAVETVERGAEAFQRVTRAPSPTGPSHHLGGDLPRLVSPVAGGERQL